MAGELILIIDDSEDMAELCELALLAEGYRVATATDGELGIARACELRPELIVLDMMMPRVDGLAVLERLPLECPPLPPVIACSGFQRFEPLAMARGAAAFVPKPFSMPALLRLVASTLARAVPSPADQASAAAYCDAARARAEGARAAFWRDASLDAALREQLRGLARWAAGYFGADTAFVTALDPAGLHVLAAHGAERTFPEGCVVDPRHAFCLDVIRAATPLVIEDAEASPVFAEHPAARGARFYAGAPLLFGDGLAIGTLCLEQQRPGSFGAEDMALLGYFAGLTGRAIGAQAAGAPGQPIFAAPRVLAEEHLRTLVEAELRRAERDRTAVALAVIPRAPTSALADRVLAASGATRLAVIARDASTVVVVGDRDLALAGARLDRALASLAIEGARVAYYGPMGTHLLSAEDFVEAARA